ncbi:uncharacterized protein LOC143849336 [Tasmannia lanceolata]|uniref:uncharacterized protein LOC143849336 n=1 Tax=Tasmannia lanceolata TaxID=3420 RepID=UPI004062C54A
MFDVVFHSDESSSTAEAWVYLTIREVVWFHTHCTTLKGRVNPEIGRVYVSINVVFEEASSWWSYDRVILPDSPELETSLQEKLNTDVPSGDGVKSTIPQEEVVLRLESSKSPKQRSPWKTNVHETKTNEEMRPSQLEESDVEVIKPRRSLRIRKPNPKFADAVYAEISGGEVGIAEPTTLKKFAKELGVTCRESALKGSVESHRRL